MSGMKKKSMQQDEKTIKRYQESIQKSRIQSNPKNWPGIFL